jgi:rod shape-determining protein MreD
MNLFKATLIGLIVVWLQLATLPALRPIGVVPNLALVCVILLASRLPVGTSLALATGIGWLLDLSSGSDYGLRTSFYLVLALVTALLRQAGSDLDNLSFLASLVIGGTVVFNLVILTNLALLHVGLPLRYVLAKVGLEVAINLVLLLLVRPLLNRLIGRNNDIVIAVGGKRG